MQDQYISRNISRRRLPVSQLRTSAWPRVVMAGAWALLLSATLATTASAKGVLPVKGHFPLMVSAQVAQPDGEGVDATTGVVIIATDPQGPAAKAGIKRGDILLLIDGAEINSMTALIERLEGAAPGDEVELFVHHGDEPRTLTVTLGARDDHAYLGVQVAALPAMETAGIMAVPALPAETGSANTVIVTATGVVSSEAQMLPLPPMELIVAEVIAGGPAAAAGLAVGDLLLQIDGAPVGTIDEVRNALKGHTPGEVVTLVVQKGGPLGAAIVPVAVTLGAAPDDATLPYLGIRLLGSKSEVAVEAGPFTAPAMPVPAPPAIPALPDAFFSYGYPAYTCGYPAVPPYAYPPAYAPPYALPAVPAAPVMIFKHRIAPQTFFYGPAEQVVQDVVVYDSIHGSVSISGAAAPTAAPGVVVKRIEMQPALPLPPAGSAEQEHVIILHAPDASSIDASGMAPPTQEPRWVAPDPASEVDPWF